MTLIVASLLGCHFCLVPHCEGLCCFLCLVTFNILLAQNVYVSSRIHLESDILVVDQQEGSHFVLSEGHGIRSFSLESCSSLVSVSLFHVSLACFFLHFDAKWLRPLQLEQTLPQAKHFSFLFSWLRPQKWQSPMSSC